MPLGERPAYHDSQSSRSEVFPLLGLSAYWVPYPVCTLKIQSLQNLRTACTMRLARFLDILLAESEGNMKTNPWMFVSLVLAFACGCMVGSTPENEAEAQVPEGPQWKYMNGTLTALNTPYVIRVDVSDPNPIPEFYTVEPEEGNFVRVPRLRHWSKAQHEPPKAKKK